MFDGVDDHVTLPTIHKLGLTDRSFLNIIFLANSSVSFAFHI